MGSKELATMTKLPNSYIAFQHTGVQDPLLEKPMFKSWEGGSSEWKPQVGQIGDPMVKLTEKALILHPVELDTSIRSKSMVTASEQASEKNNYLIEVGGISEKMKTEFLRDSW